MHSLPKRSFAGPLLSRSLAVLALVSFAVTCAAIAAPPEDPSHLPLVPATDKAAIDANMDKDVIVTGICKAAEWSDTGKVLNIRFEKTEQSHFAAVAFTSSKKRLDEAFSGDFAKTIVGANLRLRGRLSEYAGKAGSRGYPQIVISDPSQVTVVVEDK